jgi:hypothetical protein
MTGEARIAEALGTLVKIAEFWPVGNKDYYSLKVVRSLIERPMLQPMSDQACVNIPVGRNRLTSRRSHVSPVG